MPIYIRYVLFVICFPIWFLWVGANSWFLPFRAKSKISNSRWPLVIAWEETAHFLMLDKNKEDESNKN